MARQDLLSVTASWSVREIGEQRVEIFAVKCRCGAHEASMLDVAGPEDIARGRTERGTWTRFVSAARTSVCRGCQSAANRWARQILLVS